MFSDHPLIARDHPRLSRVGWGKVLTTRDRTPRQPTSERAMPHMVPSKRGARLAQRSEYIMTRTEIQNEALERARTSQALTNYPAIFEGFMAKGIAKAD